MHGFWCVGLVHLHPQLSATCHSTTSHLHEEKVLLMTAAPYTGKLLEKNRNRFYV